MRGLLRRLFGKAKPRGSAEPRGVDLGDLRTATCALFLEMATVDGEFSESERDQILRTLRKDYQLSEEDTARLLEATNQELEQSIDMWQFTRRINEACSDEEKIRIIQMLWGIVYADGSLDKHEDYLVRKLSTLLRLSHEELIRAKQKAIRKGREDTSPQP